MAGHAIPIKLRQFLDTSPEVPTGIIHHQGKDVLGYYPGQLARLHIAYPPEGQSRPFTEIQSIPVEHEIVTYHDYDYFILNQYIYYQRTRKRLLDWYILTTYREAFMLPIYKSDSAEDSYRSRAQQEAEALAVWKSNSAKRESVKPSFMGV